MKTKSQIIKAIFGESLQGQKVEADKKRLRLEFLEAALDLYNKSENKAATRSFIFTLLRR